MSVLKVISKMNPQTPCEERESLARMGVDLNDYATSLLECEPLKHTLQVKVGDWWVRNAGLPKNVSDIPGPYQRFLGALFGRSIIFSLGSSPTAVKDARRYPRDKFKKMAAWEKS